jgi:hypothetical protein
MTGRRVHRLAASLSQKPARGVKPRLKRSRQLLRERQVWVDHSGASGENRLGASPLQLDNMRSVATSHALTTLKRFGRVTRILTSRGVVSIGIAIATTILSACAFHQVHSDANHQTISLKPGDLERAGLAFITPSTVTGQEEEKQAVAFVFAEVLKERRPAIQVLALAETLSAVNAAGLAEEYRKMYADYRDTGIFKRDILAQVGGVTKTRYVAQLKLAGFTQASAGRFGFLGLRIVDTHSARVRLFFQIWDTTDGTIAWEGVHEMDYAFESMEEKAVTLRTILKETAQALVDRLP